ncbi:hypothetical protein BDV28DRAFT_148377 [Aspergillus coremiiformis]|uniref:Rhodopsin domain-containing protein n=1 Tax=Aspergillus coremiiformis TaxID=138285 RepID=A0A5N6Z6S7_9EURO|nr:hypothetical protein BDV28DRAFT_148377 [Aspergillus coremiiformis]
MSTQQGVVPPPPGVKPNFVDPQNRLGGCIPFYTFFLSLNLVALAIRLYTRRCITRDSLKLDDYFSMISFVFSVFFAGVNLKSYELGMGRHQWDIPLNKVPYIIPCYLYAFLAYIFCLAFAKLSILCFYYRLLSSQAIMKQLIIGGIVVVTIATMVLCILIYFSFTPLRQFWDSTAHSAISPTFPLWFSGVVNAITDIYVLVLPIPSVLKLKIPLRHKLKALTIIVVGASACTASIVRLACTSGMSRIDLSWETYHIGFWASAIECYQALFCSCILIFPAFVQHHWPNLKHLCCKCRRKRTSNHCDMDTSLIQPARSWPEEDPCNPQGKKHIDVYICPETGQVKARPEAHVMSSSNRPLDPDKGK